MRAEENCAKAAKTHFITRPCVLCGAHKKMFLFRKKKKKEELKGKADEAEIAPSLARSSSLTGA